MIGVLLVGCGPLAEGPADPSTGSDPVDSGTTPTSTSTSTSTSETGSSSDPGPCDLSAEAVSCPFVTVTLQTGEGPRDVRVGLPVGEPPEAGWPVVVAYQGSFFSAEHWFAGEVGDPFGIFHEASSVALLLGAGYAVVAPETLLGSSFWQTNIPPWSVFWAGSADDALVLSLLEAVDDGSLGPLDPDRLYATGISSGGYMTSRMAVSYPGRFRALAIHSASYATCSTTCLVPALPADHPPTRFLYGEDDPLVPLRTVERYHEDLLADGHVSDLQVLAGGHEWLSASGDAILAWFDAHP